MTSRVHPKCKTRYRAVYDQALTQLDDFTSQSPAFANHRQRRSWQYWLMD
jgi:hypothetical protein